MSLTYTAWVSRRIIKYGGIWVGGFTVMYLIISWGIAAYIAAHPPYIPPDVKFGVLPRIVFQDKQFTKKTFTAQLPNDSFPIYKDQAKVYVIVRPDNTFLALNLDTQTAANLKFTDKPDQIKYGVYQFKNDTLNQTLTMNVLDGSFVMKYPYDSDQLLLNPTQMPSDKDAILAAKNYLSSADKMPTDVSDSSIKVSYWQIKYDGLKSVTSLSDANIVRVDFFRDNLEDKYKFVGSDINSASISVLVTGSTVDGKKIVEVDYKYTNIDKEIFSTYPIKTSQQAWDDLQAGNYWPASDIPGTSVTIRKMYLAYFEPVTLTNYLEPIYVFEGDGKFVAYVPAITDKYVK